VRASALHDSARQHNNALASKAFAFFQTVHRIGVMCHAIGKLSMQIG